MSDGPAALRALLTAQTVRARVRVASWSAAADAVGRLLVESGRVEPRYVEAMKQAVTQIGPYMVIAPGIVLLHARPEDGVLGPCLALVTLATPVSFGHSRNDPVDLVIALGAVDKDAHIAALQQLAHLLMDQEFLTAIRSAPDDRNLLSVIQEVAI